MEARKDSNSKRVNYDNTRADKFERDVEKKGPGRKLNGRNRSAKYGKSSANGPDYAKRGSCNDLSWYTRTPSLLQGSSRLTFGEVVGQPFSVLSPDTVPGIMRIGYCPAISDYGEKALTQAMNGMYSYTVHANSRNKSYDAVDEMLIVLAAGQVFEALALGARVYGLMQLYDERNNYLPKALIQASGFSFKDLKANYSHMWFDLNERIVASRQLWVPDVMPVVKRWFWLSSNIYMDANSPKSQYYVFTPDVFLYYNETGSESGGSLSAYSNWTNKSQFSWTQYLEMVDSMISALTESQDRGIIMGDILKAYGADKIFAMNEVSLDYKVLPVYDSEVLTQIENLSVFPVRPTSVVQDTSRQRLTMHWTNNLTPDQIINQAYLSTFGSVLNFHQKEIPTEGQVMIATRLKAAGVIVREGNTAATFEIAPYISGTETVSSIQMIRREGSIDNWFTLVPNDLSFYTSEQFLKAMVYWSAFDWAPWLYTVTKATASQITIGSVVGGVIQSAIGEWDNYTFLSDEELKRMHNTAVYSEFGVPTELG